MNYNKMKLQGGRQEKYKEQLKRIKENFNGLKRKINRQIWTFFIINEEER